MSFSTWQPDDCDAPNWQAIEEALTNLAHGCTSVFVQLQEPAEASCAYVVAQEKHVRRVLQNGVRKALRLIDAHVADVVRSLDSLVDSAVGSAVVAAGQVYRDVLSSGTPGPPLPSELGRALSGFAPALGTSGDAGVPDPLTGGQVIPGAGAPIPPVSTSPLPQQVPSVLGIAEGRASQPVARGDAPAVALSTVPSEMPAQWSAQAMPPSPGQPADTSQPVDLDQPHVLLFSERGQRWHQAMSEWYGGALDKFLASASIKEVIAEREARHRALQAAQPELYTLYSSSIQG